MTLADGQRLDNIDLQLPRAGVVTGKIVDEFGDPVTDVSVMRDALSVRPGIAPADAERAAAAQTNDIGEYRIYGLSPGQYYISATLRNFIVGQPATPPIAPATRRRSIRAPATSPKRSA